MARLAELSATFCRLDAGEVAHAAARSELEGALRGGEATLVGLVHCMEAQLTADDSTVRSRAVLLLAELLPAPPRSEHDVVLARFFASKLADWPVLRGALAGVLHLLRHGQLAVDEVAELGSALVSGVHTPSLPAAERLAALSCLGVLAARHPDAARALGVALLDGTAAALEGEKEPRCLAAGFDAVARLAAALPVALLDGSSGASELQDQLAAYFPLRYAGPRDGERAPVRRRELAERLSCALTSSPAFAPRTMALLCRTLAAAAEDEEGAADAAAVLLQCCSSFAPDVLAPHVPAAWHALAPLFAGAADAPLPLSLASAAAASLTGLLAALAMSPAAASVRRTLLEEALAGAERAAAAGSMGAAACLLSAVAAAAPADGARALELAFAVAGARSQPPAAPAVAMCGRVALAATRVARSVEGAGMAVPIAVQQQALALFLAAADGPGREGEEDAGDELPWLASPSFHRDDAEVAEEEICAALWGVRGLAALLTLPSASWRLPPESRAEVVASLVAAALRPEAAGLRAEARSALCAIAVEQHALVEERALPVLLDAASQPELALAAYAALRQLVAAVPLLSIRPAVALSAATLTVLQAALTGTAAHLRARLATVVSLLLAAAGSGSFAPAADFAVAVLQVEVTVGASVDVDACMLIAGAACSAVAACDESTQLALAGACLARLSSLASTRVADVPLCFVAVAACGLRPGPPIDALQPATLLPLLAHSVVAQPLSPLLLPAVLDLVASLANKSGDEHALAAARGLPTAGPFGAECARACRVLGAIGTGMALRGAALPEAVSREPLMRVLAQGPPECASSAAAALGQPLRADCPALCRATHARTRPLWAQRHFGTVLPALLAAITPGGDEPVSTHAPPARHALLLAVAHVVAAAQPGALLVQAPSLASTLPDCLAAARSEGDAPLLGGLLGATLALLEAEGGRAALANHASPLLSSLSACAAHSHGITLPPHRATALRAIRSAAALPYARIFPLRRSVLRVLASAVDDPRRAVRALAVAARSEWAALPTDT